MPTQIKILISHERDGLERDANKFMNDKKIIKIEFDIMTISHTHDTYVAFIVYEI